jgi:hypothetical protein
MSPVAPLNWVYFCQRELSVAAALEAVASHVFEPLPVTPGHRWGRDHLPHHHHTWRLHGCMVAVLECRYGSRHFNRHL